MVAIIPPAQVQTPAPDQNFSESRIYGFLGASVPVAGNITLDVTYTGLTLLVSAAATITIPNNLPKDFNCGVIQIGAGQATVAAGAGSTLSSSLNNTAAQWAMIGIYAYDVGKVVVVGNAA